MARLPRLVVPDQAHLLVQRGHNAQPVFVDDEDRRLYLTALRDALRAHAVLLHAYALLDDAVQLLLRPPSEPALSRMVQAVGRRYVAGFNRRHGRSGTIWEGRFRAGVVQQGEPTLQALLLVDAVAVAARPGAVAAGQPLVERAAPPGPGPRPAAQRPARILAPGQHALRARGRLRGAAGARAGRGGAAPHRTCRSQRLGAGVAAVPGRDGAAVGPAGAAARQGAAAAAQAPDLSGLARIVLVREAALLLRRELI